jgi:hypothetical protein
VSASWAVLIACLWVAVVVLALLLLGVIKRVSTLLAEGNAPHAGLEPQGLPLDSYVPFFQAKDSRGRTVDRGDLIANGGLFIFVTPGCPPCDELLRQMRIPSEPMAIPLYLILDDASFGGDWNPAVGAQVLYELGGSMTRAFRNTAAPYAFAVNREGRVVERGIVNAMGELNAIADRLIEEDEAKKGSTRSEGTTQTLIMEGV